MPPTNAVQQYLHQVRTAGIRARDLVQRILAFSRRTAAMRHPVHLHLLVQEALTLLRASLPSTIAIRHHLAQDAGAVLADATQIHQVLMNLCANAEYAMRQTGGVLEVRLEAVEMDATGVGDLAQPQPWPLCAADRARYRPWHCPGCAYAHLRTVFHHQGAERWHRHGPERGLRHCHQPRVGLLRSRVLQVRERRLRSISRAA